VSQPKRPMKRRLMSEEVERRERRRSRIQEGLDRRAAKIAEAFRAERANQRLRGRRL
jgi:hypothetical protein